MLQSPDDESAYYTWVEQLLAPGIKGYEITENNTRRHVSTRFTEEETAANRSTILQLIIAHVEKKEYRRLALMAEYLRWKGHFLGIATPVMRETLKCLLVQANEAIDNGAVFKEPNILGLAKSLYDMVFHQIMFGRYELICEALYNRLTLKIEDEQFAQSWEEAQHNFAGERFPVGYYDQCEYFINYDKSRYDEDDDDDEDDSHIPPPFFFDLCAFEDKEQQLVSTTDILHVFEKYTLEILRDIVRLNFEDFHFATLLMPAEREKQSGIMIVSKDIPESLVRCIYEVMQLGNFVYTRLDGNEQVVLSPEVVDHLPDDIKDSNTTIVAATWEAFLALHDIIKH